MYFTPIWLKFNLKNFNIEVFWKVWNHNLKINFRSFECGTYCLCIFDIIWATGNFIKCAGKKRVSLQGTVCTFSCKNVNDLDTPFRNSTTQWIIVLTESIKSDFHWHNQKPIAHRVFWPQNYFAPLVSRSLGQAGCQKKRKTSRNMNY